MSAALHITREPGTTGPDAGQLAAWCEEQGLVFEPGNGYWYSDRRAVEAGIVGGASRQVTFGTIHPETAIPEVCRLAVAFWARWDGALSGDDRCLAWLAWRASVTTCKNCHGDLRRAPDGAAGRWCHDNGGLSYCVINGQVSLLTATPWE